MDDLVNKTIKVTCRQVDWVLLRSGNFSRYVRTLIDREMGAEEARLLVQAKEQTKIETPTKQPVQPVKWKFPDGQK
ncbi:MAG TPA: hypothetical protein DIC60_05970 [Lachnospiraceae bacterium]|nr:hypothetical protein [Lachnospiraceae bacterium]